MSYNTYKELLENITEGTSKTYDVTVGLYSSMGSGVVKVEVTTSDVEYIEDEVKMILDRDDVEILDYKVKR